MKTGTFSIALLLVVFHSGCSLFKSNKQASEPLPETQTVKILAIENAPIQKKMEAALEVFVKDHFINCDMDRCFSSIHSTEEKSLFRVFPVTYTNPVTKTREIHKISGMITEQNIWIFYEIREYEGALNLPNIYRHKKKEKLYKELILNKLREKADQTIY